MSRVGKKPIQIPAGVEIKIEGNAISVKGPKGAISREIPEGILIEQKENEILVSPKSINKRNKSLWGLMRMLISNMVDGVQKGFEKKLEMQGVGFKANVQGSDLVLEVGFSHDVKLSAPEGIAYSAEKNIITVSGIDKEKVGQAAAVIRRVRPPEPYKGKGIRYQGEYVRRKLGKKATGGAG
ncbi:MAG: 50S ribosomal protein L6 [Candidatus Pacebacteria bacterium]|nr:50S ribosomal protein L6 [Candidatus Paceibacterota bacterium]MDD4830776.1 50S ribosomal protein L6 [Candidatus Paceibacterota bacterium]MDD4875302.1 50S ribosomal protein L6 [Candidatus Paceibacterota bacterium]